MYNERFEKNTLSINLLMVRRRYAAPFLLGEMESEVALL